MAGAEPSSPTTILSLPEQVLSQLFERLSLRHAYNLALANNALFNIFDATFTVLDSLTPIPANTVYQTAHVLSLLRHLKHVKVLRISVPLVGNVPNLPLVELSVNDSHDESSCHKLFTVQTLTHLHIDSPLLQTPSKLYPTISRLTTLQLTNVNTQSSLLDHVEQLLSNHGQNLKNLTVTVDNESTKSVARLLRVLSKLRRLSNLQTLECGMNTMEACSRSPNHASDEYLKIKLMRLASIVQARPKRCGAGIKSVQLFTRSFQEGLLTVCLRFASDTDLVYSFAANTVVLPLVGKIVIKQLATSPCMYTLRSDFVDLDIGSLNVVNRRMAIAYNPAERLFLGKVVNTSLKVLRVQVPFRSETNLNPIIQNIIDIIEMSHIEELHISRELVHFLEQPVITTLFDHVTRIKRLYLTAPECYTEDPLPERKCAKYSAWRFLTSLPQFLQELRRRRVQLECLLLEKLGRMGDVDNPAAMIELIRHALNAIEDFESAVDVDLDTFGAQLVVWRKQFLLKTFT